MTCAKKTQSLHQIFNYFVQRVPGHTCQYCGSIGTTIEDEEHFVELSPKVTLQGPAVVCTLCGQVQYLDETAVAIQKKSNQVYKPGFLLPNQLLQ